MIKFVIALSGVFLGGLLLTLPALAVVSLTLHGELIDRPPCTVLTRDENIEVVFESMTTDYLYANGRTSSKPLDVHLIDCDITFGNAVKVTFLGTESLAVPGYLALDNGSLASGVVIGITETAGSPLLPINQQRAAQTIADGNNVISLQAFVQAEPLAQANRTIVQGTFMATATFELEYE